MLVYKNNFILFFVKANKHIQKNMEANYALLILVPSSVIFSIISATCCSPIMIPNYSFIARMS